MGLHISRLTLREAGYDLTLEDGAKQGATFLIRPIKADSESDAG